MIRTRHIATAMAVALLGAAPMVAFAQSTPSSDQILNSLTPGVGHGGGTRGLRPGAPMTAPATPDAGAPAPRASGNSRVGSNRPAPAAPTTAAASNPSANLTVDFATGSAELTPRATRVLDNLGTALTNNTLAGAHFRIEGHTDTVGTPDANKALSERRAQAVVSYLVTHFKIDPSRLEAVGMGEDGLLVQTGAQVAEPRNRRVLVVNLGA
jgi:outer membrane protein OmpA-like peptidoglycan-associated protein